MEKKNKFINWARNVFDRAVTLFPRVDQLWVGHRQESCSDRQLPALATQPQDCTNNTIEKTMDQTGKSPNPDQEMANSELGRPTYGPWMTVTNQKRKAEGSLPNRGNKAQMGNKFHDLREKGGLVKDQGQTSRTNEELGFHYKTNNSPIVENISHSPLATAKANNGEDIRLGSEFQNLQTRHQNSNSNTMAQMSNSIPSTHSGNPPPTTTEATLLQQANPQVQVQPKLRPESHRTRMEAEGENYPVEQLTVSQNRVMVFLTPGKEAFHLIASEGWIEEVKIRIQPWRQIEVGQECHMISVVALKSMEDNLKKAKELMGFVDQMSPPKFNRSSMTLLIWNCRGAGNKKFKRNLRELVQIHKPDLLVLMETKVELAAMGMFFNQMGFTTSAHVDLVGRSGGIWMLWNPSLVNVRVTEASSQLITARIAKQDYPEWLLTAVYASPISNKREDLWDSLENTA
ncbi:unnamed protein product [Camellia sinensis]